MRRHSSEIRKAWRPRVPLMTRVRNAVAIGYPIVLLVGLCVPFHMLKGAWLAYTEAFAQAGANWAADFAWQVFPMAAAAIGCLVLTVAYGVVFARRGLNLAVPFVYLATYALVGGVFYFAFAALLKSGIAVEYTILIVGVLGVLPITAGAFGYLLNTRAFQPTLFHPPVRTVKPWW